MQKNDEQSQAPEVYVVETSEALESRPDLLALVEIAPAPMIEAETLVKGVDVLQQRLPGFTQLSLRERRSMMRAANLEPELIETGLEAAAAWEHTQLYTRRTDEELRCEAEEIRRWDRAERKLQALVDGIAAANLKRKHRLGRAILQIYTALRDEMHEPDQSTVHLRPYFENMKRAYMKRVKKGRKKGKKEEGAE